MYIPSSGTGYWAAVTNGIRAIAGATEIINIINAGGNDTTIYGTGTSSDDLFLKSNTVDSYSMIKLYGLGHIRYYCNTGADHWFYAGSVNFVNFESGNYNIQFKETSSSPSNVADFGQIYTKSDNKLYFMDGDGTEHEVAFV